MNIQLNTKVLNLNDYTDFLSCVPDKVLRNSENYEFLIEVFETMDTEWQRCLDNGLEYGNAYPTTLFEAFGKRINEHYDYEYELKEVKLIVHQQFSVKEKKKTIRNLGKDAMMFESMAVISYCYNFSDVSGDIRDLHEFLKEKLTIFADAHLNTDWDYEDFIDKVMHYWNVNCEKEFIKKFK